MFNFLPFFFGKHQNSRGNIFFQMINGRGTRNRQHKRRSIKEPSYRELSHGGLIFSCRKIQRTAGASETAGCYRRPGNESEIVLLAVVKHIFVFAICEVISVLNAYYWNNVSSVFDFPDRNFRKTNMPNLALMLQFLECAQRFLNRNFRIDPMQLVEIDTLQP